MPIAARQHTPTVGNPTASGYSEYSGGSPEKFGGRRATGRAAAGWSSARRPLGRAGQALGQRHHDPDLRTAEATRVDRDLAADEADSLVEADQTEPASSSRLGEVETASVVGDGQQHVAVLARHR